MKFLKEDSQLDALSLHFETLLIRIESGQSLRQALKDAPAIECSKKWADRWSPLRERLLNGHSQAIQGLQSFRNSLLLEQKLGRLVRKKAFMPLFQACSVMLTSLLLVVFTQVWGDAIFEFTLKDYLVEFFLFSVGSYWIYLLVRALFRELWYLDWIDFLVSIEGQMSWGQNLLAAWKNTQALQTRFPQALQDYLKLSFREAQNYESLKNKTSPLVFKKKDLLQKRCVERWSQIHELFVRNESVRLLISNEAMSSYQRLENQLEYKSEKLSGLLMLPLFCCFLPASLYVVVVPLLKLFTQ